MAFQLGQFIATLMGDNSQLNQTVENSKKQLADLGKSAKEAGGRGVGNMGVNALTNGLKGATSAAMGLAQQFTTIAGIDMNSIFRLGSIAGLVAGIGSATKKWMGMQDEMQNVSNRFKMLGMDAESQTKKVYDFGKQMSESFGMAAGEARNLAMQMVQKGLHPERFEEMARSAVGLGEALGVGTQRATRMVQMLEAGNYQILRQDARFREMIQRGASRFEIENKVNELIEKGTMLAKERSNSFAGQLNRLKNAFGALGGAAANAIGPAFAPLVGKAADAVKALVQRLTDFINANKESIGSNIRMIAGVVAGAGAFMLLSGRLGMIGTLLKSLIPGFGLLTTAFKAIGGSNPLGILTKALSLFAGGLGSLPGLATKAIVGIVSAFSPVSIIGGIVAAALLPIKAVMAALAIATWALAIPVLIVKAAFMALVAAATALVAGLLVGLVGALLGAEDTFGSTASAAQDWGTSLQTIFQNLMAFIGPIWDWIRMEGMIVFKALVASARQMIEIFQNLWSGLVSLWGEVVAFFRSVFGGAIDWLISVFYEAFGNISEKWKQFTEELAIVGLRVRQLALIIGIALYSIPTIVQWLGQVFMAFATWFSNDWVNILKNSLMTFWEYLKLLGTAVQDIGTGIMNAMSGKGFTFDFSATEEQFGKLRDQAAKSLAGLEIPGLDLSQVAPGLREQLAGVTDQIADAKGAARSSQDRDRTNFQNRGTGKTGGATGPEGQGGVKIGGKDKAHFTDPAAFWKKLQEAAASQRVEQVMQMQLRQQEEMVKILGAIHAEAIAKRGDPKEAAGGVVPR